MVLTFILEKILKSKPHSSQSCVCGIYSYYITLYFMVYLEHVQKHWTRIQHIITQELNTTGSSGTSQRMPHLERLLRRVDRVHPVLQLRAPGKHKGPQNQDPERHTGLWGDTGLWRCCRRTTWSWIKSVCSPEPRLRGCWTWSRTQAWSSCWGLSLNVFLWLKQGSLSPFCTELRLDFSWVWIWRVTWTHTPEEHTGQA